MPFDAKAAWASHIEREARGKQLAELAAQHRLNLTTTHERSWYEDTWTETVVNWPAVADLLDKVAPGWDATPGVPVVQQPVAYHDKDQPNGIAWCPGYPEGLRDITPLYAGEPATAKRGALARGVVTGGEGQQR